MTVPAWEPVGQRRIFDPDVLHERYRKVWERVKEYGKSTRFFVHKPCANFLKALPRLLLRIQVLRESKNRIFRQE
jgi:hypothetical protein